ncbi:hypothetical protein SAMD00019534_071110 [Acytostelium subglobosum LB1]|uniref:hypothetical protein n=1 Tax=Acytostelium subglobosum LB1 TaxID=1410327 RepID=UPI000645018F|nr:hypothetical protein SAMD00019534_071110 [Acytostelium subglobosum LB1]GAM23936.1 hypothetical protein SAMD00019534_071110 [Acytostelium subglobosum LB1]|eukprot:XP_012752972.1 hypothetical protein SAMD00019534_071110 [Acytostelium subglobosum LB1]
MSNTTSGQQLRREQTPQGWDNSATSYDEMMAKTKFTEKYALVALDQTIPANTTLPSGIKIIDIGAGSGALSIPAAERVKPYGGTVLSTDFSPSMVNIINQKIGDLPIEAKVMDGQCLECAENTFDFAYSIFVLLFFPDQLKGAKEMHRVLRPGGKAIIALWSKSSPLMSSFGTTIGRLYSEAGLAAPPPPPYVPTSTDDQLFDHLHLSDMFKSVKIVPTQHSLDIDIDTFVRLLDSNPVVTSTKASLPESIRHKFNDTFSQVLNEKFPSGQMSGEYQAYIAIAEK